MAQTPAERRRAQRAFQREIQRGGRPLRAQGRAYRQTVARNQVPLDNHHRIEIPDGRWAYQAMARVRRSNGDIVEYYTHTYAWDESERPTRKVIRDRIAAAVEAESIDAESEVEVLSITIVHAWRDDEGY